MTAFLVPRLISIKGLLSLKLLRVKSLVFSAIIKQDGIRSGLKTCQIFYLGMLRITTKMLCLKMNELNGFISSAIPLCGTESQGCIEQENN